MHLVIEHAIGDVWVEYENRVCNIHLDFKEEKFTLGTYKEMLLIFGDLKDSLKDKGVEQIYCIVPADDEKLIKFETMMGFELYKEIADDDKLVAYIMRQEV
jgi:hypothetical protein